MQTENALKSFDGAAPGEIQEALERCEIVFFRHCPIALPAEEELRFLRDGLPRELQVKNISYHPESDSIPKFETEPAIKARVQAILKSHARRVEDYLRGALEHLVRGWTVGTTSFRPVEERGRNLSVRSSNELVHIDAGAYGATNGDRILRFFVNVHPTRDRVWGTKGSLASLLERHAELLVAARGGKERVPLRKGVTDHCYSRLIAALAKIYPLARVADSSPYDRSMRRIHNYMKETPAFRDDARDYRELHFPPLSAWMVFTDGVSHSVLTGQYALVSTFLVPLANCRERDFAPYHLLARDHSGTAQRTH